MDFPNDTIKPCKNKHLNFEERMTIQLRLKDGHTPYKIAKELNRSSNTIRNEIKRGTVTQIKQGKKVEIYLADAGEAIYRNNRKNSVPRFKRFTCKAFIDYVCDKMKTSDWSVDACFGDALKRGIFKREDMVCTKTLYNYIDLGILEIKNIDLPMKLRRNTKPSRVRKNKRNLGESIENRPKHIDTREEFGHWEIDTVIGLKDKDDSVLLTLAERKTRSYIVRKIDSKTANAVNNELDMLREELGESFSYIFKTITSDNGQEFSALHTLESVCDTKVYFTHPYASGERGTNERHNGLLRRFIPKGRAINDFSVDDIALVEEWCNTLPRKILGYNTPEELLEKELDIIHAA